MTRLFLRIFKQKSSASGEVGANQIWRKYLKVMVKSRRKVTKLKVKNESWWSSSKCFEISNLQYMYIAPSCAAPDTIREWDIPHCCCFLLSLFQNILKVN